MLRSRTEELSKENKAQAEQIDELHKQMAELKMQAGARKRTKTPVLAEVGTDITELVAMVRDENDEEERTAARALWNLAVNADNTIAIAQAGGIPPLVALVRDGNDEQKRIAARALRNLAGYADNKTAISEAGGIPPLVALVRDGNNKQKQNAAGALKSLAENAKNREAVTKPLVGGAGARWERHAENKKLKSRRRAEDSRKFL